MPLLQGNLQWALAVPLFESEAREAAYNMRLMMRVLLVVSG